jgi:hypothetical protein
VGVVWHKEGRRSKGKRKKVRKMMEREGKK